MMEYADSTVSEAVFFGGAEGLSVTFEQVYKEHFAFVWRSLRRLGVREEDANDAAQEVFIVVHRKLGEFSGRSKLTTWLYGICFRVASERRRARRPITLGEHDAISLLGRHPDPDCPRNETRGSRFSSGSWTDAPRAAGGVLPFRARRDDRRSDRRARRDPTGDGVFTPSTRAGGFRRCSCRASRSRVGPGEDSMSEDPVRLISDPNCPDERQSLLRFGVQMDPPKDAEAEVWRSLAGELGGPGRGSALPGSGLAAKYISMVGVLMLSAAGGGAILWANHHQDRSVTSAIPSAASETAAPVEAHRSCRRRPNG